MSNRNLDAIVRRNRLNAAQIRLAWVVAFIADESNDPAIRNYFVECLPGTRNAVKEAIDLIKNAA